MIAMIAGPPQVTPSLRNAAAISFMTARACRSWLHLDAPADRLPARVAALHVLRVETRVAQRDRRLAADVKAVDAEHHHRVGFRQLAGPFLHALGVAPGGAFDDVLRAGNVVPR